MWTGALTTDQRDADAWSLTFDSAPLAGDTEILGFPRVIIHGSAGAAPLHWFARLCDVAPDGTSTLVTGAGRAAKPDPLRDPLPAGDGLHAFDLHVTSWVFPRGHRVRLALSNALWPMIWPTPRQATAAVQVGDGATCVMLPVLADSAADGTQQPEPQFPRPAPASGPEGVRSWGTMVPVRWAVSRDSGGTAAVSWRGTSGTEFPWGRVADEEYLRYQVHDERPAEASARGEARTEIHLPGGCWSPRPRSTCPGTRPRYATGSAASCAATAN